MGKKRDITLLEIAFNGGIESFSPFALGLPTDKRYRHLFRQPLKLWGGGGGGGKQDALWEFYK